MSNAAQALAQVLAQMDPKLLEEALAAAKGQNEQYPHLINEIPGAIRPNKPYAYRAYPKALTPPKVIVNSADHELELRAQWGTPLPYDGDTSGAGNRQSYFLRQNYPKQMTPPQVIVENAEEERRVLASWMVGGTDPVESQKWPQYRFSAEGGGILVDNAAEAEALGPGWYLTPAEAVEAAKAQDRFRGAAPAASSGSEENERAELYRLAEERMIKVNKHWSTERLRRAVHGEAAAA